MSKILVQYLKLFVLTVAISVVAVGYKGIVEAEPEPSKSTLKSLDLSISQDNQPVRIALAGPTKGPSMPLPTEIPPFIFTLPPPPRMTLYNGPAATPTPTPTITPHPKCLTDPLKPVHCGNDVLYMCCSTSETCDTTNPIQPSCVNACPDCKNQLNDNCCGSDGSKQVVCIARNNTCCQDSNGTFVGKCAYGESCCINPVRNTRACYKSGQDDCCPDGKVCKPDNNQEERTCCLTDVETDSLTSKITGRTICIPRSGVCCNRPRGVGGRAFCPRGAKCEMNQNSNSMTCKSSR